MYSFTTSGEAPRNLDIEGVTNVRDMGGWPLEEGGYERQGMIYRGAKFNQDESAEPVVTENGIKTLQDELKIKTELDVESPASINRKKLNDKISSEILLIWRR